MAERKRKPVKKAARPRKTAKKKIADTLEKAFAAADNDKAAARVIDEVEAHALAQTAAEAEPPPTPESAAERLERKAGATPESAASIVEEAAREIASQPDESVAVPLGEAISEAARDEPSEPERIRRGRRLLRRRLFRRLRPVQAWDARLFNEVNNLPHPQVVDHAVSTFSRVMTGGHVFTAAVAADAFLHPARGRRVALGVIPALYLTTFTVEQIIKRFFRRRRPFLAIVRAIVVGRKPGSFSFPSGHSAAAFAGATLLAIYYPRRSRSLRLLAGLVAFSRIYLGAHYPGDVVCGSITGAALARIYRALVLGVVRRVNGRPPLALPPPARPLLPGRTTRESLRTR